MNSCKHCGMVDGHSPYCPSQRLGKLWDQILPKLPDEPPAIATLIGGPLHMREAKSPPNAPASGEQELRRTIDGRDHLYRGHANILLYLGWNEEA